MNSPKNFDAIVIGAGLAGGLTAFALAKRGLKILLIDSAPHIAHKSSGNLFGLITPHLSNKRSSLETLYTSGYSFTQSLLRQHSVSAQSFRATGALQLPSTKRLETIIGSKDPVFGAATANRVTASEASSISGTLIKTAAFYVPDAGFISPRTFIEQLIKEQGQMITLAMDTEVIELAQNSPDWRILCADGRTMSCSAAVVCTAYEATKLVHTSWLPLEAIRGQTVCVRHTKSSASLKGVVSFGGYITPEVAGSHFIGAHYSHDDNETSPRAADTDSMIQRCTEWLPELGLTSAEATNTRVCFRTSTIDRLPYIGSLPNYDALKKQKSKYRSGTDLEKRLTTESIPGLYVNLGHGSRGLLSCPLGGELIARLITNEPLNELTEAANVTNPARVPWRLLRSGP